MAVTVFLCLALLFCFGIYIWNATVIKDIQPNPDNKDKEFQMVTLIEGLGLLPRNSPELASVPTSETSIYKTLMLFIKNPGRKFTIEELAEIIKKSRPTMTGHVRKLVERGLVVEEKEAVMHDISVPTGDFEREYKKTRFSLNGASLTEAIKNHNKMAGKAMEKVLKQGQIVEALLQF